jgi:fatty acid desaturase
MCHDPRDWRGASSGSAAIPLGAYVYGYLLLGIAVLVVHEASHGMFILTSEPVRTTWWNWLFGTIFSALSDADHFAVAWREAHHTHHLRPNETDDPQNFNITVGRSLSRRLLACLVPGAALFVPGRRPRNALNVYERRELITRRPGSSVPVVAFALTWGSLVLLSAWATGSWVPVAVWFLGIQVLMILNELKGAAEHGGEVGLDQLRELRSRTTSTWARWLLFPFNISLHFEHHLSMWVPWYNLPAYRRALDAVVPADVRAAVENRTVGQLVAQLRGARGVVRSRHADLVDTERSAPGRLVFASGGPQASEHDAAA